MHPKNAVCIDNYNDDDDLISAFNHCRTFISYDDNTMLGMLAVLCGCHVVFVPGKRSRIELEALGQKYNGIAYGFDDIDRAESTEHLVRDDLKQMQMASIEHINNFVRICQEKW